ncbi:MAG: hypothetical protein QF921_07750 [Pseudomonadales bacterium]|jgi:hypothetical protein|nr:hypothetical protein [Pseudomonadales bacterium]MDP6472660.1 hypothetical protein [Pseudomonadales bacterium]MDP6829062.1 hypothetical protein [Pseudomonadales bacterium]MDP6971394.1 hypothetical protein [Pseudomonadales bacterium]|tara:strand:- start:130 stop:828 length:699 start_codon:yes stop_codon:yes gene_type:complete
MSEHSESQAGTQQSASVERTLSGNADLDIGGVLREAWQKTTGIKLLVFGGAVVFFFGMVVLMAILGVLINFDPLASFDRILLQVLIAALLYPFAAGVMMTGVRHSVGLPVSLEGLVAYYGAVLTIAAVGVIQSIAISIGMLLFILPGLYLSIALVLAIPLHVEKRLNVIDSLTTSLKLVNKKFLEVTILLIVVGLVVGLTSFTIIALFWTLPWMIMVGGIIYRQLAGIGLTE